MVPLAQWQILPTAFGFFALGLLFCLLLIHNGEQKRWRRVAVYSIAAVVCGATSLYVVLTYPLVSAVG